MIQPSQNLITTSSAIYTRACHHTALPPPAKWHGASGRKNILQNLKKSQICAKRAKFRPIRSVCRPFISATAAPRDPSAATAAMDRTSDRARAMDGLGGWAEEWFAGTGEADDAYESCGESPLVDTLVEGGVVLAIAGLVNVTFWGMIRFGATAGEVI